MCPDNRGHWIFVLEHRRSGVALASVADLVGSSLVEERRSPVVVVRRSLVGMLLPVAEGNRPEDRHSNLDSTWLKVNEMNLEVEVVEIEENDLGLLMNRADDLVL